MPNEPLNFRITATDEASPVVQKVDAETDALADKVVNVNIGVTGGDTGGITEEAAATAESLTAVEEAVSNMASSVSAALVALNGVAEGLVTVEEASAATAVALTAVDETMAVLGPESALAAAAASELSAALAEMQAAAAAAAEESLALEEGAMGAGTGLNFANRASTTGIRDLYRVGVIANSAGVSFAGLSTRVITSAVALAAFSNLGFVTAGAIVGGLFALGAVFDAIKGGTDEAAASAKTLTKAYEELANTLPKSTDAAGALNEHLHQMLQDSPELAQALVELGTNGGGLADAIQGGVNPAIDTARQFMSDYANTVAVARAQSGDLSGAQAELAAKYGIATSAIEKRLAASEKLVHTADAEKQANKDATDTTNTFAKAAEGLSTVAADVAAAGALWAKSNREVDTSLDPELWNRVASAAHDLALGQSLTADETAAVAQAMSAYGLTSEQVLNEGKKLWADNAKASADAAKATEAAAKKSSEAINKLGDDLGNLTDKYATTAAEAKVLQTTLDDQESAGFAVHTAFGDATDAVIKFGDDMSKIVPDMKSQGAVWDRLNKSTELSGTHLTTYTEAGRKALNATKDLSQAVDTELTQAFINAKGSSDAFIAAGHDLAAQVTNALKAAHVAPEDIPNFLEMLGLTDEQLTVRLHVAETTDALSLLQGIISDLQGDLDQNPAFRLQLRAAIQSKDPVTGLGELIQHYKDNPTVLPALVDVVSGLPPDLQAQITKWLTDHGVVLHIGSTIDTPPAPPTPDPVTYPAAVTPPTQDQLAAAAAQAGITLPLPTTAEPPSQDALTAAAAAAGITLPIPIEPKFTPISMADIMASADPATASFLSGGISGPAIPAVPVAVKPAVDEAAKATANSDLDAITKGADGQDRAAHIKVTLDGLETAGQQINAFVGADRTIHIKVAVDTPPPVSVPTTGDTGPPRSSVVVNQTINAGFGTDRFALEKAVRKANHHLNRLAGIRA